MGKPDKKEIDRILDMMIQIEKLHKEGKMDLKTFSLVDEVLREKIKEELKK
jgi:hypothetical protein